MLNLADRTNCFYWQTDRNLSAEDYARHFLNRQAVSDAILMDILRNGITGLRDSAKIEIIAPDENVLKGNVNIVRKVRIDDKPFIARFHPQGIINGYFHAEKLALQKAKEHGIPVPAVVEIHQARQPSDMDFMLMTVSEGQTLSIAIQNRTADEAAMLKKCGKVMAQIHEIAVDGYGSFDNAKAKHGALIGLHHSYRDFVHSGLDENLSRLMHFNILSHEEKREIASIFSEMNFEPQNKPCMVHNDFADWNLLTDDVRITAVLDWDECHDGDPIADLACWSTFFPTQRYASFLEGYKSQKALPQDYEERFHFYRLRYSVSKMALRAKRRLVDDSASLDELIRNGIMALAEERAWFKSLHKPESIS